MDWSRSKTIFIIVFFILDMFLISLYLNRHMEAQLVKVPGEKNIEARLKEDHITFNMLPTQTEAAPYISAKVMNFNEEDLQLEDVQQVTIENNNKLMVTLEEPIKLRNIKDKSSFNEFIRNHVYNGESYTLWKINEEEKTATFFQKVNNQTIYYNIHGMVTIYWNENDEVIQYEQTKLYDFDKYEEENLLPPFQILQILYTKNLLKPESHIKEMKLGYSTLVQLTQAQVFVPTWEVRVITSDNIEEEYFVNAVEGKIIDIQSDLTVEEDEAESLDQLKEIEEE